MPDNPRTASAVSAITCVICDAELARSVLGTVLRVNGKAEKESNHADSRATSQTA